MNTLEMWMDYVDDLARDSRVLLFDYPRELKTNQAQAAGMHTLFERLGIQKPIFVGGASLPSMDKGRHAFQRQKVSAGHRHRPRWAPASAQRNWPRQTWRQMPGHPTVVLFLASPDFCSLESPTEFFGSGNRVRGG